MSELEHELEIEIREELTIARDGIPVDETVEVTLEELLFDRADAQRYEVGLRGLLDAVQAVEEQEDAP
jgi:hypothetical protein